ncbi:hypothetical protein RhiLY_11463 [Ceratobasidium sp. AG-Ba]|nr:hypothetical protein RhiLY_11463 [Ceratobasidium sp. AG-Ba]
MQVCRYASTAGLRPGLRHPWGHTCTCTGNWLPEFAGIFRQNSGGFWLQEPGTASLVLSNTLQAMSQSQSLQEMGAFDVLLARRAKDYNPKTKRLDTLHRAVVNASTLDYIYKQPQEAATHQAKIQCQRHCIQNRK